jgi:hypothetical protein
MSDRMATEIRIGGTMSLALWEQLQQAILDEDLRIEYGDELFSNVTPVLLQEHLAAHDGVLYLAEEEQPWGMFETLEKFCMEKRIPFDRKSDGEYEFDPQLVQFRPGLPMVCLFTDHSGDPTVNRKAVVEALEQLRAGSPAAAEHTLAELLGPELPPLPPLVIVEPPVCTAIASRHLT